MICEEADFEMKEEYDEAWDDVSGAQLNTAKVKAARAEEVKVIHDFNVYDKVPVAECWSETGKPPIDTRWIDINKGDSEATLSGVRFGKTPLQQHRHWRP